MAGEPPLNKTGVGARLRRKEDDRFLHGRGQYIGDIRFPRMREIAFVRSPVAHARLTGHSHPRSPAVLGFHGQGPDRCARHPGGLAAAGLSGVRAASSGHRQDPPRRRTDRHVRRRHPRRGGRHRRPGRRRIRRTAGGRRHAQGPGAGQRAGARHRQKEHLSRGRLRRPRRSGGQDRTGEGHARAAHRAPGHVADRVSRLRRAMGHATQSVDPARRNAVSPCRPHRAGAGPANSRNPDSRGFARRRRRLRLQGDPGRRGNLPVLAGDAVRPSGPLA